MMTYYKSLSLVQEPYTAQPYCRMAIAHYSKHRPGFGEIGQVNHVKETHPAIALQAARHRRLPRGVADVLQIWWNTHPSVQNDPVFFKALLMRPDYGYAIYSELPSDAKMNTAS